MQRTILSSAVAGIIVALAAGVVAAPPGAGSPASAPALDPVVDKILSRLEKRRVHDLRARVKWELTYAIEEDSDTDRKFGQIWYKEEKPVAKFKVHFDRKVVGNRQQKLDEEHLFDGRWYIELQSRTKTVTRREIRKKTDRRNPYKLGEGAFPLPFGQKKADILREFAVRRLASRKSDPPGTDHLRLIPRPNTETGRTYKSLDFWVVREGPLAGLPIKVMAGKKDGTGSVNSYITITFSKIELNTGFSSSVFVINTPPGYEEIVERLEDPVPGATTITIPKEHKP